MPIHQSISAFFVPRAFAEHNLVELRISIARHSREIKLPKKHLSLLVTDVSYLSAQTMCHHNRIQLTPTGSKPPTATAPDRPPSTPRSPLPNHKPLGKLR